MYVLSALLKKVVPLAAVVAMVAACGSGGGSGSSSAGTLKVALIAPLTGASASAAKQMVNSAKMAIQEINADGGIDGKKLSIKVYDDQLSADTAAQVAQRAITVDKASAIIGGLSSAEGLAIREVAERTKTVYINPASTAEGITTNAVYTFRVASTTTETANAVVDIAAALKAKKIGILYDNSAAGPALRDAYEAHAKELGLTVTTAPYTESATDMSGPVQAIAKTKPDVVLIAGSANADYGLIPKTMLEQGFNRPVVGMAGTGTPDAISVGSAAFDKNGGYFVQSHDVNRKEYAAYAAAYEKAFGTTSSIADMASATYDSVNILAAALKADNAKFGAPLAKALEALPPYTGVQSRDGVPISFASTHDGLQGAFQTVYTIKGGKVVPADIVLK
jgi:branched-chain amino acid transport system substrate-binding protein